MSAIAKIFRQDLHRLHKNVIALVVVMGIVVLPSLYAWFNIAACWDPYGNTGALKVAVASDDTGYTGTVIPMQLNIGENVLSALRANTQLDWVFTTSDKAVEGVRSGEYYAAIVIPADFSTKMMSVFTTDVEKPQITYYSNDKENAIAPKVTDEGATGIQTQINQIFVKTIANSVLTALQTMSNMAEATGSGEIATTLARNLNQMAEDMYAASNTLHAFSLMADSAQQLTEMTASVLQQTQTQLQNASQKISENTASLATIRDSLSDASQKVDSALSSGKQLYSQMAQTAAPAFLSQANGAQDAADTLSSLADSTAQVQSFYQELQNALAPLQDTNPTLRQELEAVDSELEDALQAQSELESLLRDGALFLQNESADAQKNHDALSGESLPAALHSLDETYNNSVKPKLEQLSQLLDTTQQDIAQLLTQLEQSVADVDSLALTADSDLAQIQTALDAASTRLSDAAYRLQTTAQSITTLQDSQNFSVVEFLLSDNPELVAGFLSSPVQLDTTAIYPVANYGSAMAPFYTVLAIWIGGIVLVAMIRVTVPDNYIEHTGKLHPWQSYLGRFGLFAGLSFLQTSLICLGDIYYLGIQCLHPWHFLLCGWYSALVYTNIIYTLTVSFGPLGKAASVVLLVMQVAGSGGIFPIQVAPAVFRVIYPFLPFVHSMVAMRECIGGMYGDTYWREMGILTVFFAASLLLGLFFRAPVIRANQKFVQKLEKTGLI